jgi:Zn-dependent protease with chaperone function
MTGQVTAGVSWPTWATAPLVVLASFGVSWLVARLGVALALRRWRRAAGAPWTERAARAYPARQLIRSNCALVPAALGVVVFIRVAPGLGLAPTFWAALSGLAGMLGVMAVGQRLEQELCRRDGVGGGTPPEGIALFVVFLLPVLGPFGLVLALIPFRWGWPAVAVLALGAALVTVHVCGGTLLVLRRLGMAGPASPRLAEVVGRTAARVGVRPRAVFELASPNVNALAWPVPRFLLYTHPALGTWDDEELAAITAHELGHLDEPMGVYLARIVGAYLPIAAVAGIPLGGSFGPWAGLALPAVLVVGMIAVRRMARRMEERSDRMGQEPVGETTGAYARALEKGYEANLLPVVMPGRRHVHPHLYDRLIAAGRPPDYPRPGPPARAGLAALPSLLLVAACAWAIVPGSGWRLTPRQRTADALERQAMTSFQANDLDAAARRYRRAAEVDPVTPRHAANLAAVLVQLGRFDEAEQAIRRAEAALNRGADRDEATEALVAQVRAWIHSSRERIDPDGPSPRRGAPARTELPPGAP